jgi:hypothetical protein
MKRRLRGRLRRLTRMDRDRKNSRNFWRKRRLNSARSVAYMEGEKDRLDARARKVFAQRGPRI